MAFDAGHFPIRFINLLVIQVSRPADEGDGVSVLEGFLLVAKQAESDISILENPAGRIRDFRELVARTAFYE